MGLAIGSALGSIDRPRLAVEVARDPGEATVRGACLLDVPARGATALRLGASTRPAALAWGLSVRGAACRLDVGYVRSLALGGGIEASLTREGR